MRQLDEGFLAIVSAAVFAFIITCGLVTLLIIL